MINADAIRKINYMMEYSELDLTMTMLCRINRLSKTHPLDDYLIDSELNNWQIFYLYRDLDRVMK